MKWVYFIAFIICAPYALSAQSDNDESMVKQTVMDLFDAMRAHDTMKLGTCFVPEGRLLTTTKNKEGVPIIQETSVADFKRMISASKERFLDEQLTSWDILIDGNLASVWTDYLLFVDQKFSHCGVDAYQLAKVGEKWQIVQIMDTRRKENCIQRSEDHINVILNAWHNAASVADEDVFFGSMTEDGVYIGTDATERWSRDDMRSWSEKYFERDSAWDFKVKSRNIDISDNGKSAWFDELLETWMGDCRGSGVVIKTNDGWKIQHYHLSIAVPNEKVDAYLELLKKE